ncbi:MAG: UDP-glucose/GDP-mannose dehydrogenase family protein [Candidatus Paceibacterota bacterium]|jgi:UDPglucose 6-dehydrogenase
MRISIFGTGYVGLVTGACLAELGNDVVCYDINEKKIGLLKSGKIPIHEPELESLVARNIGEGRLSFTLDPKEAVRKRGAIFIAVGTPQKKNGGADLSYVENAARTIGKNLSGYAVIVTKSTVPVGTGQGIRKFIREHYEEDFDIVSNPEFLRQGSAVFDFMNPERIIVGASSDRSQKIINSLYDSFTCPILNTNLETAEMIKYASNAFLATKISFVNEIANICERVGADIEDVSYAMGLDSRIGNKFLKAGIGYGGSCFPKDVKALHNMAMTNNYDFKLLKSVIKVNNDQRLFVMRKTEKLLGDLEGRRICIWGLTFKPDTDDIRESAGVDLVRLFHKKKTIINVYDPKADYDVVREVLGGKINIAFHRDKYEAARGCHALIITTEWEEFKSADLERISGLLFEANIIDGRNIFKVDDMKKRGFNYISVGRS